MNGRLRRLFAVEDEANDALILSEALKLTVHARSCKLDVVATVAEALARLRGEAAEGGPRVDLVLCDLRLPGDDGFSLLRQLRADPRLRATPVLMLTTSRSPEDIRLAYELGANGFLPKPDGIAELVRLLDCLYDFWFEFSRVPAQLE